MAVARSGHVADGGGGERMSSTVTEAVLHSEARPAGPACETALQRAERTILVVDVVEFGRLAEIDEVDTVTRWFGLVGTIQSDILPVHGARLVKELGDGLLIELHDVPAAVATALAIQALARRRNAGLLHDRQMRLRMGIEHAMVIVDRGDLHGSAVALATRLTALAGPGEIIVSAAVRDRLVPSLDAEIEDLGPCYLKHRSEPVRAFRVGPPGARTGLPPAIAATALQPTLAVLPFATGDLVPEHRVIGEVLAGEVICHLSRSADLNVISGLSSFQFRDRVLDLAAVRQHLGADYVLSGRYRIEAGRVVLDAELAEAAPQQVVWTRQLAEPVSAILRHDREIAAQLVADVALAVMACEVKRAQCQPLPTLQSYTLLLGAVALMHRLSLADFEKARAMLETLIERAPRQSVPQAWLAKWFVLRVQQGWSDDKRRDGAQALELTRRALDTDSSCPLALAVDGMVHVNLLKQLEIGARRYTEALATNPNDALAWLLQGTLHAFMAKGREAIGATSRALKLSPLDPHRYFFESLAATAQLAAHRFERALELAERSLAANRTHTSTLRVIAIAQWNLGRQDEARRTVRDLLALEPSLTIRDYLERSPAADYATGREWAAALQGAGVPH
jgi:adenylate cyclase